jgi:hypothetical protein
MLSVRHAVAGMLNEAQKNAACHPKYVKEAQKLYQEHTEEFTNEFCSMVNRVLLVSDKEPAVDRLLKFIAQVVAIANPECCPTEEITSSQEDPPEESLTISVLRDLADWSRAENRTVRWRCCQLINLTLNALDKNYTIE